MLHRVCRLIEPFTIYALLVLALAVLVLIFVYLGWRKRFDYESGEFGIKRKDEFSGEEGTGEEEESPDEEV